MKLDPRIEAATKAHRGVKFHARRPLKELARKLDETETVTHIAISGNGKELVALTADRVMWISAKGMKSSFTSIQVRSISGAEFSGRTTGDLTIYGQGSASITVPEVLVADGEAFVRAAQ